MRFWPIWIVFALCLAVAATALGWLTVAALDSERAEVQARKQAALEENARLALWRIDSAMGALVARESAVSAQAYRPLIAPSQPSGKLLAPSVTSWTASPLARTASPHVLVHFEFDARGELSSPQAPQAPEQSRAVEKIVGRGMLLTSQRALSRVRQLMTADELLRRLPEQDNNAVADLQMGDQQPAVADPATVVAQRPAQTRAQESIGPLQPGNQPAQTEGVQQSRGVNEFRARQQYASQNTSNALWALNNDKSLSSLTAPPARVDAMTPLWVNDQLVLARRVVAGKQSLVQGCLVNWPALKQQLLESVSDLMPTADLLPAADAAGAQPHLLAAAPVQLLPGGLPVAEDGSSPIRVALALAWSAMLLAAVSVAALLRGAIALGQRRAAFASAVSHELRTPLTTFRMYAEMLEQDMVPAAERHRYLYALRAEADRLMHLVENVLSFARLERRRTQPASPVAVGELLGEGLRERLAQRARQAGMELRIDASDGMLGRQASAEPAVVDQILFNLVDNACKYAGAARDRTVHLEVDGNGSGVQFRVRDHGPGVPPERRRRLFQPFHKSASDAAHSAPGVGLGLALCRRLARGMGGTLELDPSPNGQGACFVLTLAGAKEESAPGSVRP